MNSSLRPYLDARLPAMVALLTELVQTESQTADKPGCDAAGRIIQRELRALGAAVTVHPQAIVGDHILGVLNPGAGAPIALIHHFDTVHPKGSCAPRFRIEDGKLYGPGAFDMKASSVITLNAIATLRAQNALPNREIRMLFTSDEETGSDTSRALIEQQAQGAALVMVMEPALTDGKLKSSRRGVGDWTIKAHGIASHAGSDHEKGVNAIWELALQIPLIQALTDYARGTAATVGMIHGGIARNVIPDVAEMTVDTRASKLADAGWMTSVIRGLTPKLPGARLEILGGFEREPMECNAERLRIFEQLKAIAATTGLALEHGGSGAGSDASFTAPIAPTMDGFGAVGDGLHAVHEHIVIDSLAERAAFCAAVIKDWKTLV